MKDVNHKGISRRDFFQRSVKGAIGVAVLPTILSSCSNYKGANDRIVVGHIGVGSRGTDGLLPSFKRCNEYCSLRYI